MMMIKLAAPQVCVIRNTLKGSNFDARHFQQNRYVMDLLHIQYLNKKLMIKSAKNSNNSNDAQSVISNFLIKIQVLLRACKLLKAHGCFDYIYEMKIN